MKWLTDPILETSSAVQERAERLLQGGTNLFHSTVAKVPLLSSVLVDETAEDRHETHVFLVPMEQAAEEGGYILYSCQRVPPGYAKANELPRVRIFHLPGPGAESALRILLQDDIRERLEREEAENVVEDEDGESLGDLLAKTGEIIDREGDKVTGGLLLVGGAVALVNPLLGITVASKALIPSIGGKLTTEGLKRLGDRMNRFSKRREDERLDREAEKALKKVKNLSLVNPFLAALETGKLNADLLITPTEERFTETAGCDPQALQTITARALLAIDAEMGLPEAFAEWRELLLLHVE